MPRRRKDAPSGRKNAPPPAPASRFRDRIRELRRVRSGDLVPHPKNWRIHDARQRAAMEATLAEIGWAGASIVRELPDGRLQLIDGHLRAEIDANEIVPVLIVDLDEREAEKALATHDAITLLADTDSDKLRELAAALDNDELRAALEHVADRPVIAAEAATDVEIDLGVDESALGEALTDDAPRSTEWGQAPEAKPPEYTVMVSCADEVEQREIFDKLTAEGRDCRLLIL